MTVGYYLMGPDNNSQFLDLNRLIEPTCLKCGNFLDAINYFNPAFKLNRKVYDISYTYDGRCIVSLKFKEFCIREGYEGLKFKVFEREPNFFLLHLQNEVCFDSNSSKTEFIDYCDSCKSYNEIIGFSPGHLTDNKHDLNDEFYRTDLLFGSGNSKHPFIIVASETKRKLVREELKGAYFEPIKRIY